MLRASLLPIAVLAGSLSLMTAASAAPSRTGSFCAKGKKYEGAVWVGCNGHVVVTVGTKRYKFTKGDCDRGKTYYRFQAPKSGPASVPRVTIVLGESGSPPPRNPDGTYSSVNGIAWQFFLEKSATVSLNTGSGQGTLTVTKHGHAGHFHGQLIGGGSVKGSYTCP